MCLSIVGEPDSYRASTAYDKIRRAMRRSLKRFTLTAKYADANLFDHLARAKDYHYKKILETALEKIDDRSSLVNFDDVGNFVRRG